MIEVDIVIDLQELEEMESRFIIEVLDASARELGIEVLNRALTNLEDLVYTRPNPQVTAEKMPFVEEPTGALFNSGWLKTYNPKRRGFPNQAEALSKAITKRPGVSFGQPPRGNRPGLVFVCFGVEYAINVEQGTSTGMVPRPYLAPAAEEVQEFAERFVIARLRAEGWL